MFSLLSLLEWDLMEQQRFLEQELESRRDSRRTLLELSMFTAIATYFHLACVQAANHTPGIEHVYQTLLTQWNFFHYSPKTAEHLKSVQRVFDLRELKVTKPSDTQWLAHERCVKAVKENYASLSRASMSKHMSQKHWGSTKLYQRSLL